VIFEIMLKLSDIAFIDNDNILSFEYENCEKIVTGILDKYPLQVGGVELGPENPITPSSVNVGVNVDRESVGKFDEAINNLLMELFPGSDINSIKDFDESFGILIKAIKELINADDETKFDTAVNTIDGELRALIVSGKIATDYFVNPNGFASQLGRVTAAGIDIWNYKDDLELMKEYYKGIIKKFDEINKLRKINYVIKKPEYGTLEAQGDSKYPYTLSDGMLIHLKEHPNEFNEKKIKNTVNVVDAIMDNKKPGDVLIYEGLKRMRTDDIKNLKRLRRLGTKFGDPIKNESQFVNELKNLGISVTTQDLPVIDKVLNGMDASNKVNEDPKILVEKLPVVGNVVGNVVDSKIIGVDTIVRK